MKFEGALTRFTVISIMIIFAVWIAAGACTAAERVQVNITGQKPVTCREKFAEIADEFEKIVNF